MERQLSRRRLLAVGGAGVVGALAGCLGAARPEYDRTTNHALTVGNPAWRSPADEPARRVPRETVIEGLEVPWDCAFADGELFVTERVGRVRRFVDGRLETLAEPADAIDAASVAPGEDHDGWFIEGGEGGVLGIAAHPEYPDPPLVYVYYTYRHEDGRKRNRVVEYDASAREPGRTERVVVDDIPGDAIHNGGRLAFGPANYLWVTTGDAGQGDDAQDPDSLGGKVLRVDATGAAAPGNPDLGGDPRVFSLGHRNPQGLAWLPDGTPVAAEHGPDNHDEVNVLIPGGNYSWPVAWDEAGYAGTAFARPVVNTGADDFWAPSGACFYTGDALPSWRNRLLVGGLRSQRLHVVTLVQPGRDVPPTPGPEDRVFEGWYDERYTAVVHPVLTDELGRIRAVEQGPDGAVYVLTSNRDGRAHGGFPRQGDDRLVRLG